MTFGKFFKEIAAYGVAVFAAILAGVPAVRAQTPSPLQEWQYSSGIALQRLFEPNLPDWQVVRGAAVEHKPLYDGAELTRTISGPVINIRYKGLWFASIGEPIRLSRAMAQRWNCSWRRAFNPSLKHYSRYAYRWPPAFCQSIARAESADPI